MERFLMHVTSRFDPNPAFARHPVERLGCLREQMAQLHPEYTQIFRPQVTLNYGS